MSRSFELAHSPPCITARRGGRAIQKYCEASADREAGVVFRLRTKRKTTITASRYRARASRPAASVSVASRYFINDAATLPFFRLHAVALALRGGDARRGICRSHAFRHFFRGSFGRGRETQAQPAMPNAKRARDAKGKRARSARAIARSLNGSPQPQGTAKPKNAKREPDRAKPKKRSGFRIAQIP